MRPMAWKLTQPALVEKMTATSKNPFAMKRQRKTILVDGNNVMYHFFNPLSALERDGQKIGAIEGMFQLLKRLDRMHMPEHICVFFDEKKPTARKLMDPTYKSNRRPTPRELSPQLMSVRSLLEDARVKVITCSGIEADDMIASYAKTLHANNFDVLVVSNDNDFLQLARGEPLAKLKASIDAIEAAEAVEAGGEAVAVAPAVEPTACVEVYQMNKRKYIRERNVRSRFSVSPWQLPDYFALCGMGWGKLPRVEGMTEERAVELLTKYESLPRLLRNLNEIEDDQLRKTMKQTIGNIETGHRISKLNSDLDLPFSIEELVTPECPNCNKNPLISYPSKIPYR